MVGSRVFLLGIVSAVLFRDEDGTLDFVDIPTALVPRVRTKQMIDLGVVFKASTIVETIEALLKARAEL